MSQQGVRRALNKRGGGGVGMYVVTCTCVLELYAALQLGMCVGVKTARVNCSPGLHQRRDGSGSGNPYCIMPLRHPPR